MYTSFIQQHKTVVAKVLFGLVKSLTKLLIVKNVIATAIYFKLFYLVTVMNKISLKKPPKYADFCNLTFLT